MKIFTRRAGISMAGAIFGLGLLTCPMSASAIDFKISGEWKIGFEYSNVTPRHARKTGSDYFGALQRMRLQMTAVASEQLSGTVQVELGKIEWGKAATGGALGSDGKIVELRFAYLDWMVPQTEIKVRMGIQNLMLPGVISQYGLSPIFGKEMAGISFSSPLYKSGSLNVNLSGFWARPYNDNSDDPDRLYLDNMDNFALVLPISGDGFTFKPYVMYSLMGKYSMTNLNAALGDNGQVAPRGGLMPVLGGSHTYAYFQNNYVANLNRAWGDGIWAGLTGDLNLTDDLRFAFEGVYGSVNMGSVKHYKGFEDGKDKTLDVKREGWYVGARFDYKFDWGVPGILGWYGSGDDDNPYNGSERLPQYNTPWGVSSLGFGAQVWDELTWKVLGHNPGGTAGVIAQIDKLTFIEDLSHVVRFGYYWGTNSPEMPKKAHMQWPTRADGPNAYLTKTDNAWEVNFITNYKIYENMTISLDAAYVRLNLDDDTWKGKQDTMWKDNFRVATVFAYQF